MGRLGKFVGAVILLIVAMVAGLIAFVHFYLTEERVKAFIIPQAEAALDRDVVIGNIKIGLLSGITIQDFLIKEADKSTNFISTKDFVLSYELFPLLRKKLVISEIRFDEPAVRIIRDSRGQYNFATLALFTEKTQVQERKIEEPSAAEAALPLALTINHIRINKARIKILDHLGKFPQLMPRQTPDST